MGNYARTRDGHQRADTAAWQRHCGGVTDPVVEAARKGTNRHCVQCGDEPLSGGLRCVGCFTTTAVPKRQPKTNGEPNPEPSIPFATVYGGR